jgi:hypothetical protein
MASISTKEILLYKKNRMDCQYTRVQGGDNNDEGLRGNDGLELLGRRGMRRGSCASARARAPRQGEEQSASAGARARVTTDGDDTGTSIHLRHKDAARRSRARSSRRRRWRGRRGGGSLERDELRSWASCAGRGGVRGRRFSSGARAAVPVFSDLRGGRPRVREAGAITAGGGR